LCEALRHNGPDGYDFYPETGRKYHKLIMVDSGGGRSVHAFVDKKTGEVYKSASWKSPAKGVRYDLRLIEQREWLLENADWAGGYLYANRLHYINVEIDKLRTHSKGTDCNA
jgi:hypothetical protein